jgi:dihydrofolate reductase
MQIFTLPPDWDGYPNHNHGPSAFDPNQEEVYIPLAGSATLVADGSEFELLPGTMARVGPDQLRRILNLMGGADVIRQALDQGLVDELTIIVAPVVLAGGKRVFEGFTKSLELEHIGVRQSPYATFIDYRVKRP